MEIFLCFFTAVALLGGGACDIMCFLDRMGKPSYFDSLGNPEKLCSNYPGVLSSLREDVKACEVNKISFDGAESLFQDFCATESSLMQNFVSQQQCLLEQVKHLKCPNIAIGLGGSTLEKVKEECRQRGAIESCLIDGVGKACGEGGLEVTSRFVQTLESVYEGFCAEAGGAAANSVVLWSLVFGILVAITNWH